ncbi:hemagglutinin repeat-containing protein [Kushneria sp. Sum13]|uniref:hemagglutinin repeat-containing protein n=1 Tax=Kushneria sp. Sum13 TaxID=3459196 RepID=UPI0040454E9C
MHYRSSRTKKDVVNTTTRQQGSQLTAGNTLTLVADNDLTAQASQLKAGDQAYLVGGNDVELIAANDQDYHFYQKKKKSGGLVSSKKMKRDEVTDTRAVGTTVDSGGDLTIVSGNDQVYQKARLDAGDNLTLSSGGDITFAGAMDTHSESHEKSKSNWAWQSAKGKGTTDETLRQSELIAQGQLAINAANRVNIDVRDIDQQSVSQTIDAMVAAEPKLAWLKQAEAQGDVDWRQVKEIHDSWDYKQSCVSPAVGMAVAIIAAAATSGAASSAIGMLSGTTTAATATTATSVWAAGTTAAASGWANAALSGAIAGAVGAAAGAASQGQDWQDPALHGAITGGLANYLAAGTYYGNPLNKATDLGQQISQGALLDAGKVVGGVVMQKMYGRLAEKLAKGVDLNAEELNWILMAGSIAGDQLPGIGNRYKSNDQEFTLTDSKGARGFMDSDLPGVPFNLIDSALGYQGLPDTSVRAYLMDQGFGGALTGHSLGTLTSNYLAGNRLVEHAELLHLIDTARHFLAPDGWLLLEHGHQQGQEVRAALLDAGYGGVSTCQDLGGRERVSLGQWPSPLSDSLRQEGS